MEKKYGNIKENLDYNYMRKEKIWKCNGIHCALYSNLDSNKLTSNRTQINCKNRSKNHEKKENRTHDNQSQPIPQYYKNYRLFSTELICH